MIVRYAFCGIFLIYGTLGATSFVDRLEKAVEQSDELLVEGILQEQGISGTLKEKTEALAVVAPMANDVLSKLRAERSILNDSADFTKASLGSLIGMTCAVLLSYMGRDCYQQNRLWTSNPLKNCVISGIFALGVSAGGYYACKGFTCDSQNKCIESARSIKKLLEKNQPQSEVRKK